MPNYRKHLARTRAIQRERRAFRDEPPCWCGTKHPFYADPYGECDGSGTIECLCGGDFCVCHNHGEAPCPGCLACDGYDDEGDDGDDCDDWYTDYDGSPA